VVQSQGIQKSALDQYMKMAVLARNRSMAPVRDRWNLWLKFFAVSKKFISGKDDQAVQKYVDKIVERSTHEYKAKPYQIEVSDLSALREDKIKHIIFDLKSAQTQIVNRPLLNAASVRCEALFSSP
jgi:hypothetical protein